MNLRPDAYDAVPPRALDMIMDALIAMPLAPAMHREPV